MSVEIQRFVATSLDSDARGRRNESCVVYGEAGTELRSTETFQVDAQTEEWFASYLNTRARDHIFDEARNDH